MMICAVHLLFVVQLFRALSLFATWKLMVRWGLYVSTKIKNGFEPLKNIVRIVYFMSILMRWNFNIVQQSVPVLSWGKKKEKEQMMPVSSVGLSLTDSKQMWSASTCGYEIDDSLVKQSQTWWAAEIHFNPFLSMKSSSNRHSVILYAIKTNAQVNRLHTSVIHSFNILNFL